MRVSTGPTIQVQDLGLEGSYSRDGFDMDDTDDGRSPGSAAMRIIATPGIHVKDVQLNHSSSTCRGLHPEESATSRPKPLNP